MKKEEIQIFGVTNYDQYWRSRKSRNRTYETEIHKILIELTNKYSAEGGSVLDLGVGPGHVYKELQKKFDTHGVEVSDEAFTLYDFPVNNIVKHDLQSGLPNFKIDTFDTIIASHIVHHMREPISFLEQIHSKLRENGIFILATQNISHISYRLKYFFFGKFPKVSFGHINFISPYEYENILRSLSFEIIAIRTTGSHTFLNKIFPFWFSGSLFFVCRKVKRSL